MLEWLLLGAGLLLLLGAGGSAWPGLAPASEGETSDDPPEDADTVAQEQAVVQQGAADPTGQTPEGLSARVRGKILRILAQMESGQNYGKVTVRPDQELAYGLLQTTLSSGGLAKLLTAYFAGGGQSPGLQNYLPQVQEKSASLQYDPGFLDLLRQAGTDPTMQAVQDTYFAQEFLSKAYRYATTQGFRWPVSFLTVADAFVHSGGSWPFTQNKYGSGAKIAAFPKDGADEFAVLTQYLNWRANWLANASDPGLRPTAYRPQLYLSLLQDPNLTQPVVVGGVSLAWYSYY